MIFSFQIFYSWLQITSLQSNNVHLPSAPTCPAGPGRTPKTANKACSPFRKSLRKGITTRDARSSHLLMFSLNLHNHLFRDEKTEFREDKSLSVSQRKSQKSPQVWLQTQTPYIHNSPPLRWSKHILGQTGKKKKKKMKWHCPWGACLVNTEAQPRHIRASLELEEAGQAPETRGLWYPSQATALTPKGLPCWKN